MHLTEKQNERLQSLLSVSTELSQTMKDKSPFDRHNDNGVYICGQIVNA